MNREVHVRFCERFGVKFPLPTRPKENEIKEKGASNPAHFPLETRYPALIGRLPTGLKWAALFLDVPSTRHLNFQWCPS